MAMLALSCLGIAHHLNDLSSLCFAQAKGNCITTPSSVQTCSTMCSVQGTHMGSYRPPPDMKTLMDQICSPEWYERMALPANLETLKVALSVRQDALELSRMQVRHTIYCIEKDKKRGSALNHRHTMSVI